MAKECGGFIVTQVWAEIAYTDHAGHRRKITKPATAQASDKTSQNLTDAEKQKRKIGLVSLWLPDSRKLSDRLSKSCGLIPLRHTEAGNRRGLLRLQSDIVADHTLLLTVKYERLDSPRLPGPTGTDHMTVSPSIGLFKPRLQLHLEFGGEPYSRG